MKGSDRFTANRIRVTCNCCGQSLDVINLSLGGFFVADSSHRRVGQTITFRIELPGREAFNLRGVISWINPESRSVAPGLPAGYGVRIQHIGLADKLALLHFLRERERPEARSR